MFDARGVTFDCGATTEGWPRKTVLWAGAYH